MKQNRGACHCGSIKLALQTEKDAAELGARSCQCTFCRLHGASWTSDSSGRLEIIGEENAHRYRMGTQSAEFLICANCGVAAAATWWSPDRGLLGVLRVECMDEGGMFKQGRIDTNFDAERLDDRFARRSRNWTPVILKAARADLDDPAS